MSGHQEKRGEGPGAVAKVVNRGPADRIGIQPGDIIISYDGNPIATFNDLVRAVSDSLPGDRVPIEYERNGKVTRKHIIVGVEEP